MKDEPGSNSFSLCCLSKGGAGYIMTDCGSTIRRRLLRCPDGSNVIAVFSFLTVSLSLRAKIIMEELTCGVQGYWIRAIPDMNLTHRSSEQPL